VRTSQIEESTFWADRVSVFTFPKLLERWASKLSARVLADWIENEREEKLSLIGACLYTAYASSRGVHRQESAAGTCHSHNDMIYSYVTTFNMAI
jgi:hypothetical protein